ncbi:hypothetical protein Y032_0469g2021 [Ancylostoma ceylanicum]|uniref:Uncharacterized protein n=1 Tax=Ancylostoma ceylanicum TaxID=53326 RepID=A0A016WX69_9BILA|nr:hypothetical protein Y032_0469g2021 [Ancylostoma ceylanicum]
MPSLCCGSDHVSSVKKRYGCKMEKNIYHRGGRKEVVCDDTTLAKSLYKHKWDIVEGTTENYRALFEKRRVFADRA